MPALIILANIALVAGVAYLIAGLMLSSKTHTRFGLIAVLTLAGIRAILPPEETLKLGIDLSGGTILVYQARDVGAGEAHKMDDLIAALKRRVNATGVQDIPIRKIGSNRIEIIMAKASDEDVAELKRRLTDVGQLEFRILANRKHDSAAIDRALAPGGLKRPPNRYRWAHLGEVIIGTPTASTSRTITDSHRAWTPDRFSNPTWTEAPQDASRTHITLVGTDSSKREREARFAIVGNTRDTITLAKPHNFTTIKSYIIDFNPSGIVPSDDAIVRDEDVGNGEKDRYILVKIDRHNVTGEYLAAVSQTTDEHVQPAVRFVFKPIGGRKFGALTREHSPEENGSFMYRLAILLDDMVMSAPVIKSEIREEGVIEGIPPKDIEHTIVVLRSGSLPASLDPTPLLEEKVGPTLGRDTITKGVWAIAVSMIVVPIFMLFYYHFAGAVAVVALVLNMVLLVGSMALIKATITLPGLAGLALTIGMAVDANVLIFERMREEKERGASLAQQIRNGFSRAWITILDSHLTIFLSGLVLYAIGTEEVKGFALTLFIGMIWNLFTAVYVSRVIFDFWYGRGWLSPRWMTMLKMLSKTNIDFIGPRYYFMTGSAVVILAGLAVFVAKGRSMYNIDFTGGTLVTIQLNDKAKEIADLSESDRSAYVRRVAANALPDATVETLNVGSEARGVRFNIRTTEEDAKVVKEKVQSAFKTTLARLEMTAGKPEAIPPAPKGSEAKSKGSEATAKAASPPAQRFAGGWRYDLTFNRHVEPSRVRTALGEAMKGKVPNPETRFAVAAADAAPSPAAEKATGRMALLTDLDPGEIQPILATLKARLADDPNFLYERLENFGGAVAGETRTLALIAIVASWLIIIAFLWFRFKSATYGFAAVLALVHDVLVTMGAVAISPYKIDLPMIAAFLTLIGFSVNDTIVIFDRIREIKGKTPHLTTKIVNDAINQTLSRTILTSLTAWLVVVILYLFGGEGLRGFSYCLVIGFLSGTYSTVYIATPILIDFIRDRREDAAKGAKSLVATREV
jgi:SecD/SecF fusion protein